jgi:hypothetical protein
MHYVYIQMLEKVNIIYTIDELYERTKLTKNK